MYVEPPSVAPKAVRGDTAEPSFGILFCVCMPIVFWLRLQGNTHWWTVMFSCSLTLVWSRLNVGGPVLGASDNV